MKNVTERLFELKDEAYKEFHSKLMPTIEKERIIGVRTPMVRNLAKELSVSAAADAFLKELPHFYYEENNLHACLIERINNFDACVEKLDKFLPFIDNWATCDMLRPKVLGKNKEKLLEKIKEWIKSEHTYTKRFGIEMLMVYFLDGDFDISYPETVAGIKSDEYYICMMKAWYFATALAKQYESVIPFLEEKVLDKFTHNMTVKKAIESFRITSEQKKT